MKRILRGKEMKASDSRMIHEIRVPSMVLMERAALETVREVLKRSQKDVEHLRILCLCGSGNNGGDGFAIGRIFSIKGASVECVLLGNPEHRTGETRAQQEICQKLGIPIHNGDIFCSKLKEENLADSYDVIIDAIFGIGLSREVGEPYRSVIQGMNKRRSAFLCSVDIPSGVHQDTGEVMGVALRADLTVTMAYYKPGLLLYPGASYAGEVVDVEIGIPAIPGEQEIYLPEQGDLQWIKEAEQADSNKGSYGKLLIIAGSKNMAGAAYLSAKAALTAGCGMVKLLTVEENREIIQQMLPEVMLSTYESQEEAVACLKRDLFWCDAVVCGSGMGDSERTRAIVEEVLHLDQTPLVLDADALNVLGTQKELLKQYTHELVITPHMGEMHRLSGYSMEELKRDPISCAISFAKEYGIIVIQKDSRTVTAYPNGVSYVNIYGNSGMATAGSGDVLAGITGSFYARDHHTGRAEHRFRAESAVLLHALAGDAAVEQVGKRALIARDLITGIQLVYKRFEI